MVSRTIIFTETQEFVAEQDDTKKNTKQKRKEGRNISMQHRKRKKNITREIHTIRTFSWCRKCEMSAGKNDNGIVLKVVCVNT